MMGLVGSPLLLLCIASIRRDDIQKYDLLKLVALVNCRWKSVETLGLCLVSRGYFKILKAFFMDNISPKKSPITSTVAKRVLSFSFGPLLI